MQRSLKLLMVKVEELGNVRVMRTSHLVNHGQFIRSQIIWVTFLPCSFINLVPSVRRKMTTIWADSKVVRCCLLVITLSR
jgi:hypothetical protein